MSLTSYRAAPPRVPGHRLYLKKIRLRKWKLIETRELCHRGGWLLSIHSAGLGCFISRRGGMLAHFSWISLHNFHFQNRPGLPNMPRF